MKWRVATYSVRRLGIDCELLLFEILDFQSEAKSQLYIFTASLTLKLSFILMSPASQAYV